MLMLCLQLLEARLEDEQQITAQVPLTPTRMQQSYGPKVSSLILSVDWCTSSGDLGDAFRSF